MRITAENIACERGGRPVFSNLDFSLDDGDYLELSGPNGAGKSSLLRLLANLGETRTGEIKIAGGMPDLTLAQQVHYIAHTDATKSALTVTENLKFWRDFFGEGDVGSALAATGLEPLADYPAGLLSAGQKRRIGLARLALLPRKVWLLDEPSVGLDATARDRLVTMMTGHLKAGGIIIAATHVDLGLTPTRRLALGGSA